MAAMHKETKGLHVHNHRLNANRIQLKMLLHLNIANYAPQDGPVPLRAKVCALSKKNSLDQALHTNDIPTIFVPQ